MTIQIKITYLPILLLLLGGNQVLYAQNWRCDIKPGIKYFRTTFSKNQFSETNFTKSEFSYLNKRIHPKLSIEPELFLMFYKPNNPWQFGAGISTYNWSYTSELKNEFIDTITNSSSITEISTELKAKNFQFILVGSRQLNYSKTQKSIQHHVTFGIGMNSLYPKTNFSDFFDLPNDPPIDYKTFLGKSVSGSKWSNQMSLTLLFKYELSFLNKETGLNLFNLNFSYNQGFSNLNAIRIYNYGPNLKVNLVSSTLGSGIRLGFSKTLQFEEVTPGRMNQRI